MPAISNYLANKLLDHTLRNTAYTAPATVYLALFTAPPTAGGGGTEVTGGSYARKSIAFANPASSRQIKNSANESFPSATLAWGTIVAWGLFDASSGGNLLFFGSLTDSKVVAIGEVYRQLADSLTIDMT